MNQLVWKKYFTYISNETGQLEVYVQSIPPSGQRWSISNGIGIDPIWSKKGDEILYRNTYQRYAVSVNTENEFEAGKPELLFEGSYVDVGGKSYALSPDGQRILLLKSDKGENVTDNLVIVDSWFEEVKIYIEFPKEKMKEVTAFNLQGVGVIQNKEFNRMENKYYLSEFETLKPGTYILTVITDSGKRYNHRIIKME